MASTTNSTGERHPRTVVYLLSDPAWDLGIKWFVPALWPVGIGTTYACD